VLMVSPTVQVPGSRLRRQEHHQRATKRGDDPGSTLLPDIGA